MNVLRITLLVAVLGTVFANAQVPGTDAAIGKLRKLYPPIKWNAHSAVMADVTCDGKPDTMILGIDKGKVVVAVISGADPEKPQLLFFSINRGTQDGFCAAPTRIKVAPLDCETDGGLLPGCQANKACKEFSIPDGECDPFNFYWDSSRKTIAWWRN